MARNTFVVRYARIFIKVLRYFTLSFWLRSDSWTSPLQVELWVLFNVLLSLATYALSLSNKLPLSIILIPIILGAARINDIASYQAKMLLDSPDQLGGYRRSMVLIGSNYVEIIFWFAAIYLTLGHHGWLSISGPEAVSVLRESLGLMVANDSNVLNLGADHVLPWIIVTLHSAVGLFMTTVVAARFIALLPRPNSADSDESTGV
jgi:hypothetical protein